MKILVYIGGTEDGFDNGAGSEQRYIFALAEMLALNGHDVTCAGNNHGGWGPPLWGDTKPIPGIAFVHMDDIRLDMPEQFNRDRFDLAIISENFVHWRHDGIPIATPCTEFDKIAKRVAHPLFGWAGTNLDCAEHRDASNRHFVMQPFEPVTYWPADVVVNYPVYKGLPDLEPEKRNMLVWAGKDIYHPDWKQDMPFHFGGLKVLKALVRLEQEHGVTSFFINAEKFTSERAERLGARALFDSLKLKEAHTGLVRKSVLDGAFKRARITPILQGYFSSAFSGPAAGAVPLYFEDHGGTIWHPELVHMKMEDSDETFYRVLERYFIDDDYYREQVLVGEKTIAKFHYDRSHEAFMNFARRVGIHA